MDSLDNLITNAIPTQDSGETGSAKRARIGADGLAICAVCGAPLQRRVELAFRNEPIVVRILCDCEIAEQRKREEREAEEKRLAEIGRMRRECFAEEDSYRNYTFDADDGENPALTARCKRYADTFNPEEPYGMLLYGDVGTGKTYMAAAIANRVLDRGFSVYQTDMHSIVGIMESSFSDRRMNLERILRYDLLIIDDLGAQRTTEYVMQHVYAIVDGRYRRGKPMVITTNLSANDIARARNNEAWNRVYDRILERCYLLKVTGESRRREGAVSVQELMEKRLSELP